MRVVLVGVCGSGKSTLAQGLVRLGYEVKECRQEHSGVPYMWQVLSRPDVLICLDASAEEIVRRGRHFYATGLLDDQRKRLAHARAHSDLYLMTDGLDATEVLERVTAFLADHAKRPTDLTDGTG